jgi:hypothetical protein
MPEDWKDPLPDMEIWQRHQSSKNCSVPNVGMTAPDIMNLWTQGLTSFPLTKRPHGRKVAEVRFLDIPPTKNLANVLLITAQDLHITVLMIACLFSKEEIKRPSTCDPPGSRKRRKEPGDFRWMPWSPQAKLVGIVCHLIPFF